MSEPALQVRGLTQFWGKTRALDAVSFALEPGFCALLGPNGAGKSTLIAALTGLLKPARDVVRVGGFCIHTARRQALAQLGVVFQSPSFDAERTVLANLLYHGALYGMARPEAEARAAEALARLGMEGRAGERAGALNGGHRRRMEIARALMHRPALLLLDEPTVGLDLPARMALCDHVHELANQGVAVLWATHLPDEVAPEDRVLLLHQGQIIADGRAGALTQGTALGAWFKAEVAR